MMVIICLGREISTHFFYLIEISANTYPTTTIFVTCVGCNRRTDDDPYRLSNRNDCDSMDNFSPARQLLYPIKHLVYPRLHIPTKIYGGVPLP